MLKVLATPGEVFDEVKAARYSAGNWVVPAVLFILISWVSVALIYSQPSVKQQLADMANKAIDQQVEKGVISAERAEQSRGVAEKWSGVFYLISSVVTPPIYGFVVPFWWGLILWLGGRWWLKADFGYLKAVEIAGMATMVLILDVIVRTALVLATGNMMAAPSLALLVLKDFDPKNAVHMLFAFVNVMMLWALLLRSLGLARLSGSSWGKGAVWVFGFWIVVTGFITTVSVLLQKLSSGFHG